MESMIVSEMGQDDWEVVSNIYLEGIRTGNATFETNVPTWEKWDESHVKKCRLVARRNEKVIGWAALSPVSSRCVYTGVAEVSIYISKSTSGQGVGSAILSELIKESEKEGYWSLKAGIFPENKASIMLHKKHGFREVGIQDRIGKINGVWRNVLLLERRSDVVGID
ncbi:GNAT family N-acetyltransferase [Evansella tamaricis]|uniref:GNAT family N-acetyltransferase n=1 Tax=Evansella tamaricis TaxID=2069301 RepID=A0ABS6JAY9_9BACI|nr:GNAT family N-acetyltransferase [Evansella tamaricis]MBU9710849.1 GNAT family N-acetyltransferase [Evansella tamaricis]